MCVLMVNKAAQCDYVSREKCGRPKKIAKKMNGTEIQLTQNETGEK